MVISEFYGWWLALSVFFLSTISHSAGLQPDAVEIPRDLRLAVSQFINYASSDRFTSENCEPVLKEIYQKLFIKRANDFDSASIDEHWVEISHGLFEARLILRDRLKEFDQEGQLTDGCREQILNAFRTSRFMEEYLMDLKATAAPVPGPEIPSAEIFSGPEHYLRVNPRFEKEFAGAQDLRSGDVLMSRGPDFISASIARLADQDTQFSHIAFVYIDDDGKRYTMESLIQTGAFVAPIEQYLQDTNRRSVVLRHPDGEMAARAAKRMFDHQNEYKKRTGRNFPYDFDLDLTTSDSLACMENSYWGFYWETDGALKLPLFASRVTANKYLKKAMGFKVDETFAPGDMELDYRFDIVAEWRDLAYVGDSRRRDLVMTQIYHWMNEHGYRLKPTFKSFLTRFVAWPARKVPFLRKPFVKKFPTNARPGFLATSVKLEALAETIYDHLVVQEREVMRSNGGLPFTAVDWVEALEKLRTEDAEALKRFRRWQGTQPQRGRVTVPAPEVIFHHAFRADGM